MDEQLTHLILNLIDDHVFINEAGVVELDQDALLRSLHSHHPNIDTTKLSVSIQYLGQDLPSELLTALVEAPVNALSNNALLARYRIIKPLAKGGMGDVYLAKRADGQFEKQVALKVLSKGLITNETLQRFQRERQILASLKHPHIATMLDAGVTDTQRPWFVLEFIDGERIDVYCREHKASIETRIKLFLQVCDAVEYAHQHGVIHRDIKPANILVEQSKNQPSAMVLDFGIAAQTSAQDMTSTGQIMGTPGYMSPEQTRGQIQTVDARSDVFALGVVLYELLTDSHPFIGDSATETNHNVLTNEPAQSKSRFLSGELMAITHQCLQKDPERRYPTVSDLIADCQRHLKGEPVLAQNPTWAQKAISLVKKHRLTSALSLLLLLVIIGTSWLLISQTKQAQKRHQLNQEYLMNSTTLERRLREEQMLPIHDISPAYEQIRQQIKTLEQQLSTADQSDLGHIHASIGNSYALLNQHHPAIAAFVRAESNGFNNPDMQRQYALALAQAWEQESLQLAHIPDVTQRDTQRKHIEATLLMPAQQKLQSLIQSHTQSTFLLAHLRYLEQAHPRAEALANQAAQENPGLFEAHRLAGKAAQKRGRILAIEGQADAALEAYQTASKAFEQATLVGRSDPLSHQLHCDLLTTQLHAEIIGKSVINRDKFERVDAVCLQANAILPDQFDNALSLAKLAAHINGWNAELGQYVIADANQYLNRAQRAHQLNPNNTDALGQLVMALIQVSSTENPSQTRESRNDLLRQAKTLAEQSIQINDQDAYNWANLADIHFTLADRNVQNFDITPHVQGGIFAYEQSHQLMPSYAWLYNIARLSRIYGDYHRLQQSHTEAIKAYQQAVEYFDATVGLADEFATAWMYLAQSHAHLIEQKRILREDPQSNRYAANTALDRACVLYRLKGGFTPQLNQTIEQLQAQAQFEMPNTCQN